MAYRALFSPLLLQPCSSRTGLLTAPEVLLYPIQPVCLKGLTSNRTPTSFPFCPQAFPRWLLSRPILLSFHPCLPVRPAMLLALVTSVLATLNISCSIFIRFTHVLLLILLLHRCGELDLLIHFSTLSNTRGVYPTIDA